MPDVNPSLATPSPAPVSHTVSRKRTALIVAGVGVIVLLLGGLFGGAVWLLQRSSQISPQTLPGELPTAENSSATIPMPVTSATAEPSAAVPRPIPHFLRVPAFQNNLGIAIAYSRAPQFTLRLAELQRTIENPTAVATQPSADTSYSLLRVKDAAGTIIHEQPFAVTTQLELVTVEPIQLDPTYQLSESVAYIVAPVGTQSLPALVEIVTPQGTTVDSKSFNFLELPETPTTEATMAQVSRSYSPFNKSRLAQWLTTWLGFSRAVHAQPSTCSDIGGVCGFGTGSVCCANLSCDVQNNRCVAALPSPSPPPCSGVGGVCGFGTGSVCCAALTCDIQNNRCVEGSTSPGPSATPDPSLPVCGDGVDNDGDEKIDFNDPGCHTDGDVTNSASFEVFDNDESDPATPSADPTPSPTSTTAPCTVNCFNIVVLGQSQGDVNRAADDTRDMVDSLEPWKTYASQVNVIPISVPASYNLRCLTIEGKDGNNYPSCPNNAAVAGAIAGVNWHTIVVITDVVCNCGTVSDINTSDVAAIGSNAGGAIIGHELGHSVGRMVDEYYYQFGITGGPLGPNCFASQQNCQEATTELQGANCLLGCRAVDSWRPSSQKMHSVLVDDYGPLETCVMAEQLRKVVGGEQKFGDCKVPEKSIEPPPPPARTGDYYGGRR